ncbi:MAG TPA: nucleotidyltransferase family protein [Burkholderiales bacterium]|nr:nucleotidyltransferase family protein [Burkholderiales bacterium]
MIWAVVLAAGESRRMRTQKLLLPYGGTTIIEAVVRAALDSKADEALVVLGADRGKIKEALRSYPVTFAVNRDYRSGMLSSIQAGFDALPAEAEAAVVLLGDQPDIPSAVIDDLVCNYRENDRGIIIPVYQGRRGHPLLVRTGYRQEILGLDPAVGLRQLVHAHPEDVLEVEVASPAVLKDMDTPGEYKKLASKRH